MTINLHPALFRGLLYFAFWLGAFAYPFALHAQSTPEGQHDAGAGPDASIIATGNTSGHIADLTINNKGNAPIAATLPAAIIPSEGMHQSFALPGPTSVLVDASSTVTIPLNGFCMDVDLPAPSRGSRLDVPLEWMGNAIDEEIKRFFDPPFTPTPVKQPSPATKPMGAEAVAERKDIHMDSTSSVVRKELISSETAHTDQSKPNEKYVPPAQNAETLDILIRIQHVTDSLQKAGSLKTPLSDQPQKERDAVVQQTFWSYTSDINGFSYTLEDLCEKVTEQFIKYSGSGNTPAAIASLHDGMAGLKNAIQDVGTLSKIPSFLPTPLPPASSTLSDIPPTGHPSDQVTVKATGTGRTTGHIADLTIQNKGDHPVSAKIGTGSLYIPSSGQYQPYIVPEIPLVPLQPGESKTIPVQGYCVDIHRPPVPSGGGMPDVTDWISVPGETPTPGTDIVTVPTKISLPIDDAIGILERSLPQVTSSTSNDCIPAGSGVTPTIPGSSVPMPKPTGTSSPPEDLEALQIPVLMNAIQRITTTFDELKNNGEISTPFSGNPDKEREAVIQQTFWIYASMIGDKPYEKSDFQANTVKQFEQNTKRVFDQLPDEQKDQINGGVNDFWDTFEAVGVEAKVLDVPADIPVIPAPEPHDFWKGYSSTGSKATDPPHIGSEDSFAIQPETNGKQPGSDPRLISVEDDNCECEDVTFKMNFSFQPRFRDIEKVWYGQIRKVRDTITTNRQDEPRQNLQVLPDDEIIVSITDLIATCSDCRKGECYSYKRKVFIRGEGLQGYDEYVELDDQRIEGVEEAAKKVEGAIIPGKKTTISYPSPKIAVKDLDNESEDFKNIPVRLFVKVEYNCQHDYDVCTARCKKVFEFIIERKPIKRQKKNVPAEAEVKKEE